MNTRPTLSLSTTVLALLTLLAACDGRGAAGTCPGYAACGGDPAGDWRLADACTNLTIKPYQQLSLPDQLKQPQDPTLEPPQPTPTTSGNWCSDLIFQPEDATAPVKGVVLYHDQLNIQRGTLHHNADHTYESVNTYGADEHVYFPRSCLTQYSSNAAPPSCADLAKGLDNFFQSYPSFKSFLCIEQGGGCACDYKYELVSADTGTWEIDAIDPTTIVHHSKKGSEEHRGSFCVSPDPNTNGPALTLTGADGTGLFSQQGLRSMKYVRQ